MAYNDFLRNQMPKPPKPVNTNDQQARDSLLDRQYVRPGEPFNMRRWLQGEGPHEVIFEHGKPPTPEKPS